MSQKAVISRRGVPATRDVARLESQAESLGLAVEQQLPQGVLVSGDEGQLTRLEAEGFRVKMLADTNILEVGSYRIDIENDPPAVPRNLEVPRELKETWPHHLVQLIAPPTEDWTRIIEAEGVDVVEPISRYGLFVVAAPAQVEPLAELPFVAWTGPFKPAYRLHPNLAGLTGRIRYVRMNVYPGGQLDATRGELQKARATIVAEAPPTEGYAGDYATLVCEVDARQLPRLAAFPAVRLLEFAAPEPGLDGERETQIVAENLDGAAPPNTAPVIGYQGWLAGAGLSGTGVVVAVCDTGVDTNANNNATGHLDLRGRQVAFVDYTGGVAATDTDGHGTHVAGIAVGNAATGQAEAAAPNNFLWGQGMAPQAGYVTQNALLGPWPPANWGTLTQDADTSSADVMNNSWWDGGPAGSGYTANARRFDQLVRDPAEATPELDHLVIVFSAGNAGPNPSTITPPKEAKNLITVGNSLTFRPGVGDVDDIRGLRTSSSRGPALDGRILPTILAPGTNVSSAWSETGSTAQYGQPIAGTGTPDPANPANLLNQYIFMSGTSMASPHVAGSCALLIEWWRQRTGGRNPSSALLKALLVNGAEDLVGGPSGRFTAGGAPVPLANIPNNDQGWGRVSVENVVFQPPVSDRGPKIFTDQRHAFTADGQEHMIRVAPVDTGRPMRITLVWTDAPGAANANPALVNDLDLEVVELATGNVYKGNVFANGFSTVGGTFDNRNNVECVYVQNPTGVYEVRVIAASLSANALPPFDNVAWQDFALVIDNAEVPAAAPVRVVPVIDRSGSMVAAGYVDVTKTSSKQFVDLMSVDDRVGVASFATTASKDYPTGPGPKLRTITGQPIRDAAKAAVDGLSFGGATFMGGGIATARDALNGPAAVRRAIVLLSDGYDNKGFVAANPSAMDVVATLPGNMPVYTCAMGPASDQSLLEQIATVTGGRYYFMPTIDDLFEIYNYIRGQVTGDGIIANESAVASRSRVAAFVDCGATTATFTVAWADPKLTFVPREPRRRNELGIRLRDPGGRLLHPHSSYVRRIDGKGYVVFQVQEPRPGQWFVEVATARAEHVRYTVGGFVRSSLRLVVSLRPAQVVPGAAMTIAAQVFDGRRRIGGFHASATIAGPSAGIPTLLKKHRAKLAKIRPIPASGGDRLPRDIGKLLAFQRRQLVDKKRDIFAQVVSAVPLKDLAAGQLRHLDLDHLLREEGLSLTTTAPEQTIGSSMAEPPVSGALEAAGPPAATLSASAPTGVMSGKFAGTREPGTYNIVVSAVGSSPVSKCRFARRDLVSILVK
ncbi:MAG: S8 family serine peptidase [Actinomycetota bacterium]|nr:S8 family serine peptidase [Actinomycetota bacterium]